MLLLGMLFGLLVLGPVLMLLVFAILRSERAMARLRDVPWSRASAPPAAGGESAPNGEPTS